MAKEPDWFGSFAGLESCQVEGDDYLRNVTPRGSHVAIIAPHGGRIERQTSELAGAIAGEDFSLYCFEGIRKDGNRRLHITSENFDEPKCLDLIRDCDIVVAIHGRNDKDDKDGIYLGGKDENLREEIANALESAGFQAKIHGHEFPGMKEKNICNRGRTKRGVQLELPLTLRTALANDPERRKALVSAVREAIQGSKTQ